MKSTKKICLILLVSLQIYRCVLQVSIPEKGSGDHEQVSDNVTKIDVLVCTGRGIYELTIVDKELSWFESLSLCEEMEWGSTDIALSSWARRHQVRSFLEGINFKGLNYSFWTGIFRSFDQDTNYYYNREKCKEFDDPMRVDSLQNGLCIAIERNESYTKYKESLFVDDCNNKMPFVCSKRIRNATFLSYSGFEFPKYNITSSMKPLTLCNVTIEDCKNICFNKSGCSSFNYDHDGENCTMLEIIFANDRQYHYTYYIVAASNNVTHFAKYGCQLNFTTANLSSATTVDTVIPECGIDETYSNCSCAVTESYLTEHETEEIVNKLVANLTVDPKSTAARRRKLSSADDSRHESKAVGSIGIIVLSVMLLLPVVADIFIPRVKKKSK